MITVIKTKLNHVVLRKKRQGGSHQNVGSVYVAFGNSFFYFFSLKYQFLISIHFLRFLLAFGKNSKKVSENLCRTLCPAAAAQNFLITPPGVPL